MPTTNDWKSEVKNAARREAWSLSGPSRLVKVVSPAEPPMHVATGYIGLEKSLFGKSPNEIETSLGLYKGSLARGCRVYRLLRLPLSSEVDYELTAKYPGGQFYNPAMHSKYYLPGSVAVHQWCLKSPIEVAHIRDLAAGRPYSNH